MYESARVCMHALKKRERESESTKGEVTAEQPIYEITVDYKATYGESRFSEDISFSNILMTPLKVFPTFVIC